jgi:hypothetical protein
LHCDWGLVYFWQEEIQSPQKPNEPELIFRNVRAGVEIACGILLGLIGLRKEGTTIAV